MTGLIVSGILGIFSILLLISGCSGSQQEVQVEDPFGASPMPAEFNCGPEERYKYDVSIDSEQDFVDFLRNNEISEWLSLDSFRKDGEVDWDSVLDSVTSESVGSRTVYSLVYVPFDCYDFTVRMTEDGQVSVYGCCGK